MKKILSLILLSTLALNALADIRLTNSITGNVADYGMNPQRRCSITVTLVSPNPRLVNNFLIRQDPVATTTDTNGAFTFNNFQWGIYSLNIYGAGGTQFSFVVTTNVSGAWPISALITNELALPPNPATNYYTQAQVDSRLASLAPPDLSPYATGAALTNAINNSFSSFGFIRVQPAASTNILIFSDIASAVNALNYSTSRYVGGGGIIHIGRGIFKTSTQLNLDNNFSATWILQGEGRFNSIIMDIGGNGSLISLDSAPTNDAPLNLVATDVGFYSVDGNTGTLLELGTHFGDVNIERCAFGDWRAITNNFPVNNGTVDFGNNFPLQAGLDRFATPIFAPSVTGIHAGGSQGHGPNISYSTFQALNPGIWIGCNHAWIFRNFFECCRNSPAPLADDQNTASSSEAWQKLGAAIVIDEDALQDIRGGWNHFYFCYAGYLVAAAGGSDRPSFKDDTFETCGFSFIFQAGGGAVSYEWASLTDKPNINTTFSRPSPDFDWTVDLTPLPAGSLLAWGPVGSGWEFDGNVTINGRALSTNLFGNGANLTNLNAANVTGTLPASVQYGGTPAFVTNAPGLISSASILGKPYDGCILFSFTTSAATQVMLTNLFTFTLSKANSTNWLVPVFSQYWSGSFTNNQQGANALTTRLAAMPNPASPSNSFILFVETSALVASAQYTMAIHIDRP